MNDLRRGKLEVSPYYFKVDMQFFHDNIEDFLPGQVIDIHTHVTGPEEAKRGAPPPTFWTDRVCPNGMALPSLLESYTLMFPGKRIRPVPFAMPPRGFDACFDRDTANSYVARQSRKFGLTPLIMTDPSWSPQELERRVKENGFRGLKPYPSAIAKAPDGVEIYDYLPKSHLEVADEKKWLVILHIPRSERLADPVNIRQLREVDEEYPKARVVVAHVGRAYCPRYGEALDDLKDTQNLLFDISANANQTVFEKLIETVKADRIVFGSDMPIAAMHARRVCEGDNYVNVVLGADWEDDHTRIGSPEDRITFFLYEEIVAFKRAAENEGLSSADIRKIFYKNAARILGLQ